MSKAATYGLTYTLRERSRKSGCCRWKKVQLPSPSQHHRRHKMLLTLHLPRSAPLLYLAKLLLGILRSTHYHIHCQTIQLLRPGQRYKTAGVLNLMGHFSICLHGRRSKVTPKCRQSTHFMANYSSTLCRQRRTEV